MPPSGHSPIGASKSKQWMACPGSRRMQAGIPNKSSEYAQEGTQAHYLHELCLRGGQDASEYVGTTIAMPCGDGDPVIFEVTGDMAEAVQLSLDMIREDMAAHPGGELQIEKSFHLEQLHPLLWGSCDAVYGEAFGTLYVYDYKHGAGVAVDVEENPQLMFYALGACHNEDYGDVVLTIVQPRAAHPDGPIRRWTTTQKALEAWGRDVLGPAAHETDQPDALLRAGDHCRFCLAQHKCPELRATACQVAAFDDELFDDQFLPVSPAAQITLPAPADLTPDQLSKVLDFADVIESWISAVKAHAYEEAMSGRAVPGWKVVAGRKGNRAWADPEGLLGKLHKYRQEIYERPKIKSVAQMEKAIKAAGDDPTIVLKDLVVRPDGKPTLVREADKRPALCVNAVNAFDDFLNIEDDL